MAAGYVNACGTPEARAAIAKYHSTSSAEDVIVANGASGALELALTALLDVCIKCVFECVNVIDLKNSNIVYANTIPLCDIFTGRINIVGTKTWIPIVRSHCQKSRRISAALRCIAESRMGMRFGPHGIRPKRVERMY